jgi:hypothetical protein
MEGLGVVVMGGGRGWMVDVKARLWGSEGKRKNNNTLVRRIP